MNTIFVSCCQFPWQGIKQTYHHLPHFLEIILDFFRSMSSLQFCFFKKLTQNLTPRTSNGSATWDLECRRQCGYLRFHGTMWPSHLRSHGLRREKNISFRILGFLDPLTKMNYSTPCPEIWYFSERIYFGSRSILLSGTRGHQNVQDVAIMALCLRSRWARPLSHYVHWS